MTRDEHLAYAGGQIHAHLCVLRAFIATHPERGALRQEFGRLLNIAEGMTLPEPVRETYLQGLREEATSLFGGL